MESRQIRSYIMDLRDESEISILMPTDAIFLSVECEHLPVMHWLVDPFSMEDYRHFKIFHSHDFVEDPNKLTFLGHYVDDVSLPCFLFERR